MCTEDIETAIEVVQRIKKSRRWEEEIYLACKITIDELWKEHSKQQKRKEHKKNAKL